MMMRRNNQLKLLLPTVATTSDITLVVNRTIKTEKNDMGGSNKNFAATTTTDNGDNNHNHKYNESNGNNTDANDDHDSYYDGLGRRKLGLLK